MEMETPGAMQDEAADICQNCLFPIRTPFCGQCGQKQSARLSFSVIVKDTFSHLTNLDFALARTVIHLFKNPGKVGREYIKGRRIYYFNPLKYLFLISTFYVLIVNSFEIDIYPAAFDPPDEKARKVFNLILSLAGYLIFLQLLVVAWIQKLLFRKKGYNAAENYAFLGFIFGQVVWFHLLFACLGLFGTTHGFGVLLGIDMIYIALALTRFYENHGLGTILKSILLFVFYFVTKSITGILLNIFLVLRG